LPNPLRVRKIFPLNASEWRQNQPRGLPVAKSSSSSVVQQRTANQSEINHRSEMKPETIATTSAARLFTTYKSLIRYTALAALAFTLTARAGASLMYISFDDGGNNVGAGVIDVEDGYAVDGYFTVSAGLATGDWTLFDGTAASPGAGSSPGGFFNYDNLVYLGSDPYLSLNGGLLFTNTTGDQLNLWADAPDTYSLWAADGSGNYYVQAGYYSGFSGATGYGTSTITNAPAGTGVVQITAPTLSIQPAADGFTLLWADTGTAFRLLQNTDLTTTNWVASTNQVTLASGTNSAAITATTGSLFFRLITP
jgi:hypothetical protein